MLAFKYERMLSGWLIGYYRKQLHLSQKDLLSATQMPCSLKTLGKLEHGHVVNDEHVYARLAHSLHRSAHLDAAFLQRMMKYRLDLYRYLLQYSKSGMKRLLTVITHELDCHQPLVIHEILHIYQQLLLFELYHQLPDEASLQLMIFLSDKVCHEDQRLICFMLHRCKAVFGEVMLDIHDPLFFGIHLDAICSSSPLMKSYHHLHTLQSDNTLSTYQRILLLHHMALLQFRGHDLQSAYKTMKKAIQLYHNDFCDPLLATLQADMGYICYTLNHYHDAIQHFTISLQINASCMTHHLLLFFHAYEKLNRQQELNQLLIQNNYPMMDEKITHAIFHYYHIKYQTAPSNEKWQRMEHYLCHDFKPLYSYSDHASILVDELLALSSKTGNYKSLYQILTLLKAN